MSTVICQVNMNSKQLPYQPLELSSSSAFSDFLAYQNHRVELPISPDFGLHLSPVRASYLAGYCCVVLISYPEQATVLSS